jgi:hypothetical protein
MVLVYRWGSGRLGAVSVCGESLGGSIMGGGARKTQNATAVDIFALYKTVVSAK